MALDPSIILAGRQPDMVGQYGRGLAAGQLQTQIGQQNALAKLYSEQGPGIIAGDQGALNSLAMLDPKAAMGVQSDRLGMQSTQQTMDRLSREEKRQVEAQAAAMSAADRKAAADAMEQAVRMGMTAQSPEQWDVLMTQIGAPELVGQFANRQALAARGMEMADVLKMVNPDPVDPTKGAPSGYMWTQPGNPQAGVVPIPGMADKGFRPATPEEAARYGAAAGQVGADGRFYPINPPSGMSIETGPDGQMRIVQGPGAGGNAKPFTESQSKDVTFATKAEGALRTLDPIAGELTSLSGRAAESDPTGFIRGQVQSDNYQVAKTSGDEFLQAILRKESGAAITPAEQAMYGITYLPQPGDSDAVMKYKAEARKRAVDAIKAGMSADQMLARERALGADPNAAAGGQGSTQFDPNSDPEAKALLEKYK